MEYIGEIAVLPHSNQRLATRRVVNFAASVRDAGSRCTKVKIHDLTQTGCRVSLPQRLPPDAEVWVKVTGMNPVRAKVAWARDGEAGCEFAVPLDLDVLESLVEKPKRATAMMFGRRGA